MITPLDVRLHDIFKVGLISYSVGGFGGALLLFGLFFAKEYISPWMGISVATVLIGGLLIMVCTLLFAFCAFLFEASKGGSHA